MTKRRNGIYTGKANYDISSIELGFDTGKRRTLKELQEAENEFFDKLWYVRHQWSKQRCKDGRISQDPQICAEAEESAKRVERSYGDVVEWYPQTDYEQGFLEGTLSAVRWAMGDYFGFLDT